MSLYKDCILLLLLAVNIYSVVSGDGVNVTASETADRQIQALSLGPPGAVAAAELGSAAFKPGLDSLFSLSLFSSYPEEISDYCRELLQIFGQRCAAHVNCLASAARPVKVCQNCFASNSSLVSIYNNISLQMGPGNVSCSNSILRSDRLMVVNLLYSNLEELWSNSNCDYCITKGFLNNDTLYFMTMLNQTLTCFEYHQRNSTELCNTCNGTYKNLSQLYSGMEKNQSLCIDIEDAMNMTRRLWSMNFNCSKSREETVPIIAVSSFMLFLPIIFYLSSFLHSEQKKRKLIHPKRAKSYSSLANFQDKLN